jgi:hypothetical protein
MIEFTRVQKGIALYFSREMADVVREYLIRKGYLTRDNLFDIDRVYSDLRAIASKTGTVAEHFPLIGDVVFSIDDINCIRDCIIGD